MAAGIRDGKPIGFTESERQHLTRYAALQDDGTILLNLAGIPPRGEEDSDVVVKILLNKFVSDGESWELGGRGTRDDDLLVVRTSDPRINLSVQVTRALTSRRFLKRLHLEGRISGMRIRPSETIDALRASIEHKSHIPPAHRSQMILALDAFRVPAFALGDVASRFLQMEGKWASSLGFYSIFIIGPTETFVHRLDR